MTILLVVLILMLLGALPTWPYSRSWGYYPSGGLGLVLVILIVLVLARAVEFQSCFVPRHRHGTRQFHLSRTLLSPACGGFGLNFLTGRGADIDLLRQFRQGLIRFLLFIQRLLQ